MRKQTKKILSWVLSAAMVLGMGTGFVGKGASAEDEPVSGTANSSAILYNGDIDYNLGGDGDCRIQIMNKWGGHVGPDVLQNTTFTDLEVTFTVENVANALAAIEKESVTAVLASDANEWKNTPSNAVITEDGTYTVKLSYDSVQDSSVVNYLAVRVEDFDSLFEKSDNGSVAKDETSAPIFSDVKLKIVQRPVEPEPTVEPTIAPTETPDDPSVAENDAIWSAEGVHAYIYYQTDKYDCRDDFGKASTHPDPFDEYGYRFIKAGGQDVSKAVPVKDVLITKDGTYTCKIEGIDLSGATYFNMLGISTDLTVSPEEQKAASDAEKDGKQYEYSVKVTNATVKIDDEAVDALTNVSLPHNDESNYYLFTAANMYSHTDPSVPYSSYDESYLEILPEDSIEISFTISGISKKGDDPAPTKAPGASAAPGATAAPETGAEVELVKEGTVVSAGNFKYKVTKAATASKAGAAKVVGLTATGKKAKSLVVPASIKKNGAKVNITALGKSAFKGAKATSITIKSKKVKNIPSKAFNKCKKLTKLTLSAKLKKAKKGAFKGCKKKIAVKGKAKKAIKKLLKKVYKKIK